jgi:plastocyanin
VRITSKAEHVTRLSRQPAAITGILLAVSIGLTLLFGTDLTSGGQETIVRITSQGFSPQTAHVNVGGRITWVNDSTAAHTLQSDRLCTRDRHCLLTRSIAPQSSTSLSITEDFSPGSYPYYSITRQGMEGTVMVLASQEPAPPATAKTTKQQNLESVLPLAELAANAVTPPAGGGADGSPSSRAGLPPPSSARSAASSRPADLDADSPTSLLRDGPLPPLDATWGAPDPATQESSSAQRSRADVSALIPSNPYTINSTRTHPFDEEGNPIKPGSGSSLSKKSVTQLHGGAPVRRPITQPSTGPGLWITIVGAFGLLFLSTYRLLRKQRA